MKSADRTKILSIGVGVIAAGFLLKKLGSAAKEAVETVVDENIAKPIADTYLAVTLPGNVELQGTVQLPDGTRFPLSYISVGTDLSFIYSKKRYRIAEHRGSTYYAVV